MTTLVITRIAIERMAMSLYQDHSFMHRQKLSPAERTQQPKPPTWPELGTQLRNVWRQNAIQLLQEQQYSFSDETIQDILP